MRKRFKNLKKFQMFLWDKKQKSMHIKIDDTHAIILDEKSSYLVGTIVTMSDFCWCILV